MDLLRHGESSTSPSPPHSHPNGLAVPKPEPPTSTSRLILPTWDIPGEKHLHPSLDLISLLHLDTLYNTYVRPYADVEDDDDRPGGGGGKVKRRRLERGYQGLIDDCIDPTPLGEKRDHQSLLPLITDLMVPPGPPTPLWCEPLEMLPLEMFQAARLDPGTKQEGYGGGEKLGVREAEDRRRRKKARHSQTFLPELPSPALPSPTTEYPMDQLAPVPPPTRGYPINPAHRPPTAHPIRPFPKGGRPAQSVPPRPSQGMGGGIPHKRPLEGGSGGQQKRIKTGTGSRSASPASGPGRPTGPGGRSRTEGI